jgi:hypothetical protein
MMQNVNMKVEGTKLVITVDLAYKGGTSKSGKSEIIATTGGNVTVPGTQAKLGLNLYNPR